ncbi:TetR/AcrR family transcriptional regulator [Capillimicrobium parvum]|uniref:HTH tetR-type domain-containing protein n=1 Tax=Capillimicrobium parvum TaxID=2884022 RepID=A0A9E6XXJ3_9ACTN|nr:TetR/AcrR family transcriptional regulator [Capillimicrobium parvum]UGS35572.1 hypothetical protein DSM104329_01965 [Capillimicrobium parvum]
MSVGEESPSSAAQRRWETLAARVAQMREAIPYVTANTELLESRRSQIAEAAYAAFCANGFRSTSVSDVAGLAGMDKRTLYDYVGDKPDLLYLVFLHFLPDQVKRMGSALRDRDDPVMQLQRMGRAHLRFLAEYPGLGLLYYREMRYLHREQIRDLLWLIGETITLYRTAIERGAAAGLIVTDDAHVAARVFAAGLDMPSLTAWDLASSDPKIVEREILRFALDGLRAR